MPEVAQSIAKLDKQIKQLTAIKKERIEKTLQNIADLAVVDAESGRSFVLVYQDSEGKTHTVQGVAFSGYGETSNNEEVFGKSTVFLDDEGHDDVYCRYRSLNDLTGRLSKRDIPHVIKFCSEDDVA